MKVLLVSSFAYPHLGGVSRHIEMLLTGLFRFEWVGEVISLSNLGFLEKASFAPFFILRQVSKKNAGKYLINAKKNSLRAEILKLGNSLNSFDLIHVHDVLACCAAIEALEELGTKKPIVLTVHGFIANEINAKYALSPSALSMLKSMEEKAYSSADYVISVEKNRDAEVGKFRNATHSVIHNWIDTDAYAPTPQEEKGTFDILVPRRLVKKNGVAYVVKALEYLPEQFRLVVTGTGPESSSISGYAEEKGLSGRLLLTDRISDSELKERYANSDAVVIPSIQYRGDVEGLSMALLESLSMGKVVVVTNVGGNPEVISDGINGFVVPPEDAKAIASVLSKVKGDPELKERIETNARRTAVEKYSIKAGTTNTLKVYKEVLGQ